MPCRRETEITLDGKDKKIASGHANKLTRKEFKKHQSTVQC